MKMIEQSKKIAKTEDIYLAIIYGLKAGDKMSKMWDRAISIKTELTKAGFKIVRKPGS